MSQNRESNKQKNNGNTEWRQRTKSIDYLNMD